MKEHDKNVVKYARVILVESMLGARIRGRDITDRMAGVIPARALSVYADFRCPELHGCHLYQVRNGNSTLPVYPNGYWAPVAELPPGLRDNEAVIQSLCSVHGQTWLTAQPRTSYSSESKDVNYLRDVVADLPALFTWCRAVLADVVRPRTLGRFPKVPDNQTYEKLEDGRHYPVYYADNLSDSTVLGMWDTFVDTGKLPFTFQKLSDIVSMNQHYHGANEFIMVLQGELAPSPLVHRKVSGAEVREYVKDLAEFVRQCPIAVGLMVLGEATDDAYVRWFIVNHSNWGMGIHGYTSSRYQANWQSAMTNEAARDMLLAEDREARGGEPETDVDRRGNRYDVPLLTKMNAAVNAIRYATERLLKKGIPLQATKELVVAFHNKLMEVDNGIAAELSLSTDSQLAKAAGGRAMVVASFKDKDALMKEVRKRIVFTNAKYFEDLPEKYRPAATESEG